MKTVSFVMPVCNPPEDAFRRQLDSILGQKGVGIEVVAVDDGSTNGALAILREYESAHPGVFRILVRANRGAGPSRNEGFLAATGDYVWFVDADDLVRPGAAARLAGVLDETGAEMLLFGFIEDPRTEKPFPEEWDLCATRTTALAEIARNRCGPWCRICRRDFLERVGVRYCDASTGEDAPEHFRWLCESSSLFQIPDPCYRYIRTFFSITSKKPDVRFFAKGWQVMDLYDDLCGRFPECAPWLELRNFTRARGHIALAGRFLAAVPPHAPEELEAVRAAREEYVRRFRKLDPGNPLIACFDQARTVGHWDCVPRMAKAKTESNAAKAETKAAKAETKAAKAETKAAKAETKREMRANAALSKRIATLERKLAGRDRALADIRSSLSWRLTAPLRAIMGLVVRPRSAR